MSTRQHTNRTTILQVGIAAAILFAFVVLISAVFAEGVGAPRGADPEAAAVGSAGRPGNQERETVVGRMTGRVAESSGVATSAAHPGVLWTHDDGGDGRLHAIGFDGAWRASLSVTGVRAVDWEDLARAPCPGPPSGDCLFIADTGDNDALRESVRILVVREPPRLEGETSTAPLAVASFRYPQGPTDAEALAIGSDGRALIVSKGHEGRARLYELSPEAFGVGADSAIREARFVAALPIDVGEPDHRVTGAALSPDGRTLAVRTRSEIYLIGVDEWSRGPRLCPVGGSQPQGEAVAWIDAETLVLTSEGAESPILSVRCP